MSSLNQCWTDNDKSWRTSLRRWAKTSMEPRVDFPGRAHKGHAKLDRSLSDRSLQLASSPETALHFLPVTVYEPAAVCRRGHVATSNMTDEGEPSPRCPTCGAMVLTECLACGYRIQGDELLSTLGWYNPPDFCDQCGRAHPWASRQARLYQLENLLDEQDLDPADRLI